ncbi:hypothetical protein GGI16_008176 [Coemansia sp. S142-1]|nr:hypothetical protein GGI16_008176 [Coemansia sp. S142-1]
MDNQNSTYSPPKLATSLQSPPAYSGNSVQQQGPQVVYVKSDPQQEKPNLRGGGAGCCGLGLLAGCCAGMLCC